MSPGKNHFSLLSSNWEEVEYCKIDQSIFRYHCNSHCMWSNNWQLVTNIIIRCLRDSCLWTNDKKPTQCTLVIPGSDWPNHPSSYSDNFDNISSDTNMPQLRLWHGYKQLTEWYDNCILLNIYFYTALFVCRLRKIILLNPLILGAQGILIISSQLL